MEGEKIETPNKEQEFQEIEELRQELERLRTQNEELKKALLSSLDARIYSLLGLCGFPTTSEDAASED